MTQPEYYDITIIGGGPVGMFAATYARMRLAKTQIIESLDQLGGQVATLFPAKKIYDIPGYPAITGEELISNLKQQLETFAPDIFLGETVQSFVKTSAGFKITTSKRITYSKTIIIATGAGAFEPRKLTLENATSFEGRNLHYFIKDPSIFQGQDIAIAGGGDSAIDWALELVPSVRSLHLVHRRDKFRALEANLEALKQTKTNFQTPYLIADLSQVDNKLKIQLKSKTAPQKEIYVDHLLVNYGFTSDPKLINSWDLALHQREIQVNDQHETSLAQVYAIGDIAYHPGKINLIATGFGEAPSAVNNALLAIYPEKRQPAHSTQLIKKFKAESDKP